MRYLFLWLVKPFHRHIVFFVLLFLLISSADCYYYISKALIPYTVYVAFHNLITVYLLVQIISIIPDKYEKACKVIFFSIASLFCMSDLFCVINFGNCFNNDYAGIIRGTNINEISEFVSSFITLRYVLTLAAIFLFLSAVSYMMWKRNLHIRGQNHLYIRNFTNSDRHFAVYSQSYLERDIHREDICLCVYRRCSRLKRAYHPSEVGDYTR